MKRYTIGCITLKRFTNSILLFLQNLTIIHLLKRVDISQLYHRQDSLIKKMKPDVISIQPYNFLLQ